MRLDAIQDQLCEIGPSHNIISPDNKMSLHEHIHEHSFATPLQNF